MSNSWPKLIRDPVHDLIPFEDCPCDRLLLSLIDTPEFQRLRRIKQLGMSELVFPGANHSRFAHLLGVLHMARLILQRVRRVWAGLGEGHELIVLAAALLHDLGHGPFSHAFESVTGEDHEFRTHQIISDPGTGVHRALSECGAEVPKLVAMFFDEENGEEKLRRANFPVFLKQVISSQLDADRFDYLLRDSHSSGTGYGQFDYRWIISHLHLEEARGRFYLSRKALLPTEAYLMARERMYRVVYFHKTTRSGEVMLRLAFKRYRELLRCERRNPRRTVSVRHGVRRRDPLPEALPALRRVFLAEGAASLEDYLELDDDTITEFLRAAQQSADPQLNTLASGLLNRQLYKAIDLSDMEDPVLPQEFRRAAEAKITELGLNPAYALVSDRPQDTAYKPYDPGSDRQPDLIYVEGDDGRSREISKIRPRLRELMSKYTLERFYFPPHLRDQMDAVAHVTLRRPA